MKSSTVMLFAALAVQCLVPSSQVPSRCATIKLLNGRVRARARGRIVRFTCNEGFTLVGNKYSTCIKGKWDTPTPVCVNSECPVPPTPEHAVMAPKFNGAILIYFCEAGYLLIGTSEIYCDGKEWNGTTPYCRGKNADPPTHCDFEKPDLCWWEQDPQHDFDWQRHNHETPSYHIGTGPTHDHTLGKGYDGYYLYIEASGRLVNDTARIASPFYNASLTESGCFSFWYHMYGATIGALRIYFVEERGGTEELMFTKEGNQGNQWHHGKFDLPEAAADFQIIIEGVRGANYVSDIAIDDVDIFQGEQCNEKEPSTTAPSNDDQLEIVSAQLTCRDRCVSTLTPNNSNLTNMAFTPDCLCTLDCADFSLCCPDYAEYCVLGITDGAYPTEAVTISQVTTTRSSRRNESDIVTIKPHSPIWIIPKDDIDPATTALTTARTITKVPKITTRATPGTKDIHTKVTPFATPTPVTKKYVNETGTRHQEPEKLHAGYLDVPSIVEAVAGILAVVCGVATIVVLLIKRRKSYKRGSKGSTLSEDSDVRFLTSDEVLDFNLARPSDDDP